MNPPRLSVAGFLLLGLVPACAARAADLTVGVPPGPAQLAADGAFLQPFAAAAAVTVAALPVASAEPAPPRVDARLVDGRSLLVGCKAGAFQKLDWSAIGGRDRPLTAAASDCGVGAWVRAIALAWSRDKFSATPTWSDFWDVARIPGKRGLRRGARGNFEFALIADGVAPADVYGTLRDAAGVDRALRKLDQLKPYVVWWKTDDEAPGLLASGDVLMTSAPADGVLAAAKGASGVKPRDFAVQWAGGLFFVDSWVVPAAGPTPPLVAKFLRFATDPKQQARLDGYPGFGSAVTGGMDGLGAAEKAASPSTPANLAAGLFADEAFWRDNEAKLDQQFEAWLAKP